MLCEHSAGKGALCSMKLVPLHERQEYIQQLGGSFAMGLVDQVRFKISVYYLQQLLLPDLNLRPSTGLEGS